jgi:type VI secretion system protein ImpA
MSARWPGEEALLEPITPEKPCGDNLEDTELLASFDIFRLFGQSRPLDAPAEPDEKRVPKPADSPEWIGIRDKSLEALRKSKDLRLLAYLGTALLRTDGLPAFAATINVASLWLESHWNEVYPLVDEDAILRRNALNNFGDSMAIVDRLRRIPLVSTRQHGRFSLRDIDIATHQLPAGEGDKPVDENQINAAFDAIPIEELTQLSDSVATATGAVRKIETTMRESAGSEASPSYEALTAQLARIAQVLRTRLAARAGASEEAAAGASGEAAAGGPSIGGVVRSRQDVVRALDAIAAFYRQAEPSSPIPMLLERAKRLVSKDFLEVIAEIAPDALGSARAAGGLRNE